MFYDIKPVSKPRQTQRDKWKPSKAVLRYRAFADECRLKIKGLHTELAHCTVTFAIPMPKSWSKKKREAHRGQYHTQKPDLDNLFKALGDALHGNDSHIHTIRAQKVWDERGGIIIKHTGELT